MHVGNIPKAVCRDALGVAGGMFRMNAGYACGYVFDASRDGKSVGYGEFVARPEEALGRDGYIDFEDKTMTCLRTGKKITLK